MFPPGIRRFTFGIPLFGYFSYMRHSKLQSKKYFQIQYQCQCWSLDMMHVNPVPKIVSLPNISLEIVVLLGDNFPHLSFVIFQKITLYI